MRKNYLLGYETFLNFILAGKAVFRAVGTRENNLTRKLTDMSFKVIKEAVKEDEEAGGWRVYVWFKDYPEEADAKAWKTIGFIYKRDMRFGGCDGARRDLRWELSRFALLWNWAWSRDLKLEEDIDLMHHGYCARCNRKLVAPKSNRLGLGPVCAKKVRKFSGVGIPWSGQDLF